MVETSLNDSEEDDLLGGLDADSSAEVKVPDTLLNQVIGQEHARNVVKKAAEQRRHLLMIGSPGTGKSMLSKAMTEILPSKGLKDVLVYKNEKDDNNPRVRTVPSGKGTKIIEAHRDEVAKKQKIRRALAAVIFLLVVGYAFIIAGQVLLGIIAGGIIFLIYKFGLADLDADVPELLVDNSGSDSAPFKDATGAHSGAILGDVRHDPYQSGQMATSAHKRVESGLIHEANGGVLFIDEVNTLDIKDQQKLMTAIQEGEFSITGQSERSSGAMVKTQPVPTSFTMVAAGNMDAIDNMHPALRDRIRGYGYEVYMNDKVDDSPEMRRKYAQFVAQEVRKDDNIKHFSRGAMEEIVRQAQRRAGEKGKLTLKLRDLGGLVRAAGDISNNDSSEYVTKEHVLEAKETARSIEQQLVDRRMEKKEKYGLDVDESGQVGHVNGLAVMGDDTGIVLPVASAVTPAQGSGRIIATGKLQEIAEEAVQNVSALIKKISGETLGDKDVHIQFIQTYEGVDGDSASVTVAAAILSALTGTPIRQDVAMTGSISVRGEVLPVGGVTHKIEAAAKAGINKVIIPESNRDDVTIEPKHAENIEIVTATHLADILEEAFEPNKKLNRFAEKLRRENDEGLLSFSDLQPNSIIAMEENK